MVTNSFLLAGGDGYRVFTSAGDAADPSVGGGRNQVNTFLIDADVVQEYIEPRPSRTINPRLEGRITFSYRVRIPLVYTLTAEQPQAAAAD